MERRLLELKEQTIRQIKQAAVLDELEKIAVRVLGKKGELTDILKGVGKLSVAERPVVGKIANKIKTEIKRVMEEKKDKLGIEAREKSLKDDVVDTSLPGKRSVIGRAHPLNIITSEIVQIFSRLGFSVKEGPDIEDEYHNFEALNIPADHPARDMHDTFYMKNGNVLRTHTSPAQIHIMKKTKPPVKIIVPGKVYRCDSDITHSPVFHQIEGLFVDRSVSVAELKGVLGFFLHELFGHNKKIRFRPSYFPFTEPSTEVDVQCVKCDGSGCNLCKNTGWIEILGAGMVNRNVFRSVGYDPDEVTGFAFGLGVERIAMLQYEIHDIRLFYENDLRFLKQF